MRKYILFGVPIVGIVASFLLCRIQGTQFLSKESWQIQDIAATLKRITQEPPAVRSLDRTLLLRPVSVVGISIVVAVFTAIFCAPSCG